MPSGEMWCRVVSCNAEWRAVMSSGELWYRVANCDAEWRVVMPSSAIDWVENPIYNRLRWEFFQVVVSSLHLTWSIKIRCTDRELPTVEDRCERCDLTPVQYSNRCVVGTVRASHKKGINRWWSERGTAKAEHRPRLSMIWGPDPLRVVRHFYTLRISQGYCVVYIIFSFCSLFS